MCVCVCVCVCDSIARNIVYSTYERIHEVLIMYVYHLLHQNISPGAVYTCYVYEFTKNGYVLYERMHNMYTYNHTNVPL